MKTAISKPGVHNDYQKNAGSAGHLKTDLPLSEKDEIKRAEEKMRKTRRKLL